MKNNYSFMKQYDKIWVYKLSEYGKERVKELSQHLPQGTEKKNLKMGKPMKFKPTISEYEAKHCNASWHTP
jgi:hypothetical protein